MQLSPIQETSTTASLTDNEESVYDKYDLNELFDELRKSNKPTTKEEKDDDEFTKIKKSIARLPKMNDSTGSLTEEVTKNMNRKTSTKGGQNVVVISDTIEAATKNNQKEKLAWEDLPKTDITAEIKRDFKVISQRAALDPKRHYKKGTWKEPERFQIGTIVEGNTEYYSARLKKKERTQTILQSVLQDEDTKHYFKRKYDEIQTKKTSGKKAHYKKVQAARRKF